MKKLGYFGIFLIQSSYLPQIYRVYRGGPHPSPAFILMIWAGLICLQIYSYSIGDKIYIASNWLGLFNTSLLLFLIMI